MQAYRVYLANTHIDTVFYIKGTPAEEVREGLILHDGYHPQIVVIPE